MDVEAAYLAARENTSPEKVYLEAVPQGRETDKFSLTVIPQETVTNELMLVFSKVHPESGTPGPPVTTIHDSSLALDCPLEFGDDGFAVLRVTAMDTSASLDQWLGGLAISSHVQCWYLDDFNEELSGLKRRQRSEREALVQEVIDSNGCIDLSNLKKGKSKRKKGMMKKTNHGKTKRANNEGENMEAKGRTMKKTEGKSKSKSGETKSANNEGENVEAKGRMMKKT